MGSYISEKVICQHPLAFPFGRLRPSRSSRRPLLSLFSLFLLGEKSAKKPTVAGILAELPLKGNPGK